MCVIPCLRFVPGIARGVGDSHVKEQSSHCPWGDVFSPLQFSLHIDLLDELRLTQKLKHYRWQWSLTLSCLVLTSYWVLHSALIRIFFMSNAVWIFSILCAIRCLRRVPCICSGLGWFQDDRTKWTLSMVGKKLLLFNSCGVMSVSGLID